MFLSFYIFTSAFCFCHFLLQLFNFTQRLKLLLLITQENGKVNLMLDLALIEMLKVHYSLLPIRIIMYTGQIMRIRERTIFSEIPVVDVKKHFLQEFWKIQIFPLAETARIGHFKSNKQLQICLKLAFKCRFRRQNKHFQFLNF